MRATVYDWSEWRLTRRFSRTKGNLSYLLHSQKLRQLAFAAELDRYARDQQAEVNKWPRN